MDPGIYNKMNKSKKNSYSYGSSGVDVELGRKFVDIIKPLAQTTANHGNTAEIGGFGAIFDIKSSGFKDPLLVAATDGVGTKLLLANQINGHRTVGVDLVAMCVNDLVVQGAKPLFFLDYIASGTLDTSVATEVVEGIAEGCREAQCALIGGETAEMPGLYSRGHYDLAGFAVGAVERHHVIKGDKVKPGDQILALESSGFHANGYSLIRQILSSEDVQLSEPSPFSQGESIGEALLQPTRIYTRSILQLLAKTRPAGKGIGHITGGGFYENIPRVLPEYTEAVINANWEPPSCFRWLQQAGNLSAEEMFNTFNCGVGMIIIIDPESVDEAITCLKATRESVFHIGEIHKSNTKSQRVVIKGLQDQWS